MISSSQTEGDTTAPVSVRQLVKVGCVALLCLVFFNVGLHSRARSAGKEMLARIPAGKTFDTIVIGNSTMAAGFQHQEFARVRGVNESEVLLLALGGVSLQEMALLLEEALARGVRAARVVLGYHDHHLDGVNGGTWSYFVGACNLIYFADERRGRDLYQLHGLEWLKVRVTRRFPMLVYRSNLWAHVERLRRYLSGFGTPVKIEGRFGRVEDFKFYPFDSTAREEAHAAWGEMAKSNAPASAALRRIGGECHRAQIQLVVIEMPLSPERVALCAPDPRWQAHRQRCRALAEGLGAQFLAGIDWCDSADQFEDPVHLNAIGAARFSTRLAEALNMGSKRQ